MFERLFEFVDVFVNLLLKFVSVRVLVFSLVILFCVFYYSQILFLLCLIFLLVLSPVRATKNNFFQKIDFPKKQLFQKYRFFPKKQLFQKKIFFDKITFLKIIVYEK